MVTCHALFLYRNHMWDIYIHFCLLLLNLVIWVTKYGHLSSTLRILGFVLLITFLIEGYAAYLMLHRIRNLYLYHLLTPLQYALFSLVFYTALTGAKQKRVILLSIPLYLLVSLLITLYLEGLSEYNSYALSIKNGFIICWTLLYYKDVFEGLKIMRLNREPMFWISTGLFFYSLGSFFIDGLMNQVMGNFFEIANALFYISIFLGYLLYITFLIAFLLEGKARLFALE